MEFCEVSKTEGEEGMSKAKTVLRVFREANQPKQQTVNPVVDDNYKTAVAVIVADSFQKANQVTEDLELIKKFKRAFSAGASYGI
jgi:hypothetical protein